MKFNKEIKIGFLAIIGIMMSVFSYNYLKGINLFEKKDICPHPASLARAKVGTDINELLIRSSP